MDIQNIHVGNQLIVSAAADETLRFWDVFASPSKTHTGKRGAADSVGGSKSKNLRTMHNIR